MKKTERKYSEQDLSRLLQIYLKSKQMRSIFESSIPLEDQKWAQEHHANLLLQFPNEKLQESRQYVVSLFQTDMKEISHWVQEMKAQKEKAFEQYKNYAPYLWMVRKEEIASEDFQKAFKRVHIVDLTKPANKEMQVFYSS